MDTIADHFVVEINYTLTNNDGETIDSSKGKAPLAYLHGKKNIVSGLEKALTGKKVGDSFNVSVKPEEGYGVRNEGMVQAFPKANFGPEVDKLQEGMVVQISGPDGEPAVAVVTNIGDEEVTLDINHPLAGETLNFGIEVVSLRGATLSEIESGVPDQPKSECCASNNCCD